MFFRRPECTATAAMSNGFRRAYKKIIGSVFWCKAADSDWRLNINSG